MDCVSPPPPLSPLLPHAASPLCRGRSRGGVRGDGGRELGEVQKNLNFSTDHGIPHLLFFSPDSSVRLRQSQYFPHLLGSWLSRTSHKKFTFLLGLVAEIFNWTTVKIRPNAWQKSNFWGHYNSSIISPNIETLVLWNIIILQFGWKDFVIFAHPWYEASRGKSSNQTSLSFLPSLPSATLLLCCDWTNTVIYQQCQVTWSHQSQWWRSLFRCRDSSAAFSFYIVNVSGDLPTHSTE